MSSIISESDKYVLKTYNRIPIVIDYGKDVWLYDDNGNKFLDLASGIAVSSLGYGNKDLENAISNQSRKILHTSNYFYTEPYTLLAKTLVKNSVFDKVFFCNSGAEANEAAIKLIRRYGWLTGIKNKYNIITLKNSFHGRSMATITATGQPRFHEGFHPMVEGFQYVEINNIDELKSCFSETTAGVIFESIQAEGGINVCNIDFIKKTRELCDKYNALMIFDEVQTGVGRTGNLFGYMDFFPIEPDAITLAKGLAAGLPIGALLLKNKIKNVLIPGTHASTFGGNPVSCSAGKVVIDTIINNNLTENVKQNGQYFIDQLNKLKYKYKIIKEIRGKGFLIGIELNKEMDCHDLMDLLFNNKILSVPANNNVLRFLPPLILKKEHIDFAIDKLDSILKSI